MTEFKNDARFHAILKKYWNYPSFRSVQLDIIRSVANGKDTFAILPTGGGKSICFQVPALFLSGLTVVISPLIALMEDQVFQLHKRNIPAAFLHSGLSQDKQLEIIEDAISGVIKILYLSPERVNSSFYEKYWHLFPLSLIAIDESHCISQWGHDFRPSYLQLTHLREDFSNVPILAVTASATPLVQKDIIKYLELKNVQRFSQSVIRDNLRYKVSYAENKLKSIIDYVASFNATGIVYANSRKLTHSISEILEKEGLNSCFYHAGLPLEKRKEQQELWMQSKNHIIVATNAFGMGIDKPNVRHVSHFLLPHSLEEYYQEAGRAGRDGEEAEAMVFYNNKDIEKLEEYITIQFPPIKWIKEVYHKVCDYLKIANNSGAEQYFSFAIEDFLKKQNLPALPCLAAIKLIEKEGYWEYENAGETQTKLTLNLNNEDLNTLKTYHPNYHEVIVQILRMYGSVFNFETTIDTHLIAKNLQKTPYYIHQVLLALRSMNYIYYTPAIKGAYLYFLKDRKNKYEFELNTKKITSLKEAYRTRIEAFKEYLLNKTTCRNLLIATYFGENIQELYPCGKCDNCQNTTNYHTRKTTKHEFIQWIKENEGSTLNEVQSVYKHLPQEQIATWIRELIDTNQYFLDELDKIFKSK